jgi:uracil-DNA glycosylase family 4
MLCPNKFPIIPSNRRIALIGEAPGYDEERVGEPFVGYSGKFLGQLLSRAGVSRDTCFFGNVTQHRPPNNEIFQFRWSGPEIQSGLDSLTADLERFNPNICVLLGNSPLKAAKDNYSDHPLIGKAFRNKVSSWRGSYFIGGPGPFEGRKCMASYHPAYCQRDYEQTPFLQLDLRKAVTQSEFRELRLTARHVEVCDTVEKVRANLTQIRAAKQLVSVDLEGYVNCMTCIGFGVSKNYAFVIPLKKKNRTPCWTPYDIVQVWRLLAMALEDVQVPKTFQYGLYDTFVLHYGHGIRVQNYSADTIHKHWELYSELAKADGHRATARRGMGLAVQASIYTDFPYWKDEMESEDDYTHYKYCGTDCLITKEIDGTIENIFNGDGGGGFTKDHLDSMRKHYAFNGSLLPAFRYLSIRGIKYDKATATERCNILKAKIYEAQARINGLSGARFKWNSLSEIRNRAAEVMLVKKGDRPRAGMAESWERFKELMKVPNPNLSTLGEIENLCEVSMNVDSPKQFNSYLYETVGLPIQYNDDKLNPKPTSDYEALLRLAKFCLDKEHPALAIIHLAIEIRALATRIENLSVDAEPNGRMVFSFNIVGSNTGRTQCGKSATDRGRPGQGIPKYTNVKDAPGGILGDRDLFGADDECWMAQMDLKGADGWTVAAYAAMHGDPTMLDDYRAGLKPARIMAMMLRGLFVSPDRVQLREDCKIIDDDDWEYFAGKRVQHGASYLEGAQTIGRNILTDSEGKLWISVKECEALKEDCFFKRYPGIRRWHNWLASKIAQSPILVAASGQVRNFFGRPDEILTKAVAFEPQSNTTYATNLALQKLWYDESNRTKQEGKVRFIIEPLHQIHDAVCVQFPKNKTDWAITKIRTYFDNELRIAGQILVIPFDGSYGKSWGELKQGKI